MVVLDDEYCCLAKEVEEVFVLPELTVCSDDDFVDGREVIRDDGVLDVSPPELTLGVGCSCEVNIYN